MVKINLKTPEEIAKEANKIKYKLEKSEQKNNIFVILSKRIKLILLVIKL